MKILIIFLLPLNSLSYWASIDEVENIESINNDIVLINSNDCYITEDDEERCDYEIESSELDNQVPE